MKTIFLQLLAFATVSVAVGAAHYFLRGGEAVFAVPAAPAVLKEGDVSLAEVRAIVAEKTPGVVLVDARPDLFFNEGHIPGAGGVAGAGFSERNNSRLPW
jgi:hypothetical protein